MTITVTSIDTVEPLHQVMAIDSWGWNEQGDVIMVIRDQKHVDMSLVRAMNAAYRQWQRQQAAPCNG